VLSADPRDATAELEAVFSARSERWPREGRHAIQTPVYGSCFLPRTLVWSLPWSPSHVFPRFVQNLMHTRCRIHHETASGQIHDSK
jgi:hypothetical protein